MTYQKGHPKSYNPTIEQSIERGKKISSTKKGKPMSDKNRNSLQLYWNSLIGRKLSEEIRTKISESHKGIVPLNILRGDLTGKNHPNWKGGISKDKAYQGHFKNLRKDRVRGAVGTHSISEWRALKEKYQYMCLCCKKQEPLITLTRDHIIPIVIGGTNDISNIQPLCRPCNSRKFTKCIDFVKRITLPIYAI